MNISQVLLEISKNFSNKKIDNYNLEAEMLLSFVIKKSREFLFAHGEKEISFWQNFKINRLAVKRLKGYSLAVIMREKEFYGRKFYVNKNVLVPRPETEILISEIFDIKSLILNKKINFIDVGTGSGCIILSLIKEIEKKISFQSSVLRFYALDISPKALNVAKKNAKTLEARAEIKFLKSDLLKKLIKRGDRFDGLTIITANLPYLTSKQVASSITIQKEPRVALVAGDDGLLYYRRLFKQLIAMRNETASSSLISRKKVHCEAREVALGHDSKVIVFCEIDEVQVNGIKGLINEILGDVKVEIKKDLQGLDRLVIIEV